MKPRLGNVSTWPAAITSSITHHCVVCPRCAAVVPVYYAVTHQQWHQTLPEAPSDGHRPDPEC